MTDLRDQLRAVPSSLNDACRTMEVAADQIDLLVKALEMIASGTKDWEYPFRAMPESEMRKIACEALKFATHDAVGGPGNGR